MKIKTLALAVTVALPLLLAGCFGGSSDEPVAETPPTEVPASATASTTAFVAYTGSLAASETAEPLNVANATPPTSETEEPQTVN